MYKYIIYIYIAHSIYIHEHPVSQLRVCLSAEGATNVSWPWLSPLRRWGSLTMSHTGKSVYMAHHFILLQLNPVDWEGWWFEHSVRQSRDCLSAEGATNVSWPWLSPFRGWGSLAMSLTGKFVYIYNHSVVNTIYIYIYIYGIHH